MEKKKELGVFLLGAAGYPIIEILWRGYTHWSMSLTGGAGLLAVFRAEHRLRRHPLMVKCLAGSALITATELLSGCLFNRLLRLNVWDYSQENYNLGGQICARYSALWFLLCVPLVGVCRAIRQRG